MALKVVDDQLGVPTAAPLLAEGLLDMAARRSRCPRVFGILPMKDMHIMAWVCAGNRACGPAGCACRGGVFGCLSHCGASSILERVGRRGPSKQKWGGVGHPLERGAPKVLGVEKRCVNFPPRMTDEALLNEVRAKAQAWTQLPHDEDTRLTVQQWLDGCDDDQSVEKHSSMRFTWICRSARAGFEANGPGHQPHQRHHHCQCHPRLRQPLEKGVRRCVRRTKTPKWQWPATAVTAAKSLPKSPPRSCRPMALSRGSILSCGPLHNCRGRFESWARWGGGGDREPQPLDLQRLQGVRVGWWTGRRT